MLNLADILKISREDGKRRTHTPTDNMLKKQEDFDEKTAPQILSVVPFLPKRPNREFGRDADTPKARKQDAIYLRTFPRTQIFIKVLKVSIVGNLVSC